MKTSSAYLFTIYFAVAGLSCANGEVSDAVSNVYGNIYNMNDEVHSIDEKIGCDAPPLSKEVLIDIFVRQIGWQLDDDHKFGDDYKYLKKTSDFTILEDKDRCVYKVVHDKSLPIRSGRKVSVRINRKGEVMSTFFEVNESVCDDPPLSEEQAINIYLKEYHRKTGRYFGKTEEEEYSIEKLGREYTIIYHVREDNSCIYHISCIFKRKGSASVLLHGGPFVEIDRKGKVLGYSRSP